jgi:hypothetical protein
VPADEPRDARHVDDARGARRELGAQAQEDATQVDVDHARELRGRGVGGARHRPLDAGGVHRKIEPAHRAHQRVHLRLVGHVHARLHVRADDLRALLLQRVGARAADPLRRPRDQRDPSCEPHAGPSPSAGLMCLAAKLEGA